MNLSVTVLMGAATTFLPGAALIPSCTAQRQVNSSGSASTVIPGVIGRIVGWHVVGLQQVRNLPAVWHLDVAVHALVSGMLCGVIIIGS